MGFVCMCCREGVDEGGSWAKVKDGRGGSSRLAALAGDFLQDLQGQKLG